MDVPILHLPPKCHTVPGSPLRSAVILTFQSFRIIEIRYGHLQVKCLVLKGLCVLTSCLKGDYLQNRLKRSDYMRGTRTGKIVKRREISLSLCKQNDYNGMNLTSAKEI